MWTFQYPLRANGLRSHGNSRAGTRVYAISVPSTGQWIEKPLDLANDLLSRENFSTLYGPMD